MAKNIEEVMQEINSQEEESYQPFVVEDLDTAAEAQRRIAFFKDQMDEVDAIMEKQIQPFLDKIEKIKGWADENKQEYVEKISNYEALLNNYIVEEVTKAQKAGKKPKKTIKLPYGSISLKKQQPKFEKEEDLLLAHAKRLGYFKVEEKTDWATFKKNCTVSNGKLYDENGEIVPGVVVEERPDRFENKLK